MKKSLKEVLMEAESSGQAVGHFNISNIEGLWGVFRAAQAQNQPVIIGVSEGERDFIGVAQTRALVDSVQKEFDFPIYLNADHTYSVERVKEVIDAGYDSVIFDGSALPFEENVKQTRSCVDYARSCGREVLVEGELGFIGQSSKLLDDIPEGVDLNNLTSPEEAKRFVQETGVDLIAPAVGNIHGMIRGMGNPKLDIERVHNIRQAVGIPMVLHGGSGIADRDFTEAIKAGICEVHISTELRLAYRDALRAELQAEPDEIAPYKMLKNAVQAIRQAAEKRIKLFAGK